MPSIRSLPLFARDMTRPPPCLVLVSLCLALVATSLQANPFHVSPTGNDTNDGSERAPFRTIERARDAVRAITGGQTGDIVVYLRGGRYELSDTLRFDANDSGRNGHRVIYRAYPGESVSISGGRRVGNWSYFRDGIHRADAPVPAFRQLYVNGARGTRARTPNHGYHRLSSWNDDRTITLPASQFAPGWQLDGVEMVIEKHWHQSRLRIDSVSREGEVAVVVPREPERSVEWLVPWPNREPNQVYYLENSLDFLDQPGEWYLDRKDQQIYYLPRPGEDLQSAEVIVPTLERLLEIRGASDLHFIGLTFEHATWTAPCEEGFIGIQGNYYRTADGIGWIPSAIHLESTRKVRLERNVIRNLGGGAIELAFGTDRTRIIGNAIADIGAGGISVYTWLSNRNPPEEKKSRGDLIRNNFVTRVAADYPGGVAILATYTDGLIVEHNEVFDNPYSGLSVGWGWTSDDTALRNNRVRYNRIHQVMHQLDDGAGIYTLSKQPGTVIEENFVYNMTRSPWAGSYEITALYLDEQSEGITLRNNVVRNLEGVNAFKQNQVREGANEVYDNGPDIPNADAIIEKAGLQEAFLDIRQKVLHPGRPLPFSGTPAPIPGRIQAEDFDHGGPGVAYHDSTAVNQGGEYRLDEQVDIEACADTGGGFNVGYTAPGEWLEYTIHIERSGLYRFLARVAAVQEGEKFRLLVDGADVTGSIEVPNTGGWQQWTTVAGGEVELEAGERRLRLHFDTGNINVNWLELVGVNQPFHAAPLAIPGRIRAVEFDRGGPGVAYHDTTEVNQGGGFRPEEQVDIEPSTDPDAAYNVGWIADGEWLDYTVAVAETGTYEIRFRVAGLLDGGRFRLLLDGEDLTGAIMAPATGGWQQWTTVTGPQVTMPQGQRMLRLVIETGGFNISSMEFERVPPMVPEILSFDQWREAHFSAEELLDPAISGPAADPHQSGVSNLLNYTFNRSPGDRARTHLPAAGTITIGDNTYFTLAYTRLAEATDLDIRVETSPDLIQWSPAGDGVIEVSTERTGESERVLVRDAEPIRQSEQRFFRLRVELISPE